MGGEVFRRRPEVEQVVQLHQIGGDGDERRGYDAAMDKVLHRQEQQWLVWRLALGGLRPDRTGGAREGGEEFESVGEVSHIYTLNKITYKQACFNLPT